MSLHFVTAELGMHNAIPAVVMVDPTGNPSEIGVPSSPNTGTLSSVTAVTSSAPILAANIDRKGGTVYNDSTAVLRLRLSAGSASATAFTVLLIAGGYFEIPFGYRGAITGIWDAVNGAARVTEFTLA